MIKVNIWFPIDKNVGHTSAFIGYENDATFTEYVSWWPQNGYSNTKSRSGIGYSYMDDKLEEGNRSLNIPKEPDRTWSFAGLDENAAAKWWGDFKSNSQSKYDISDTNCSWAVMKMLKAGGSDNMIPWMHFPKKINFPVISNPADSIIRYWRKVYELSKKLTMNESLLFAMVHFVDENSSVWSPIDVDSYCDVLTRSIEGRPNPFIDIDKIIPGYSKIRNIGKKI